MDSYKVKKIQSKPDICVEVPGSKSITNRALLMAAMSDGRTVLDGVQFSEDSSYFLEALESLGFNVEADKKNCRVIIEGLGGKIPKDNGDIYVGSAGTAARFYSVCRYGRRNIQSGFIRADEKKTYEGAFHCS